MFHARRFAASLLILTGLTVTAGANAATPKPAAYNWDSVKVGGGGYIPNVIFSPIEKDIAYARTDMGGIYRWDQAKGRWLPLEDDQAEKNYQGIESVAVDPVTPGVVYAAIGTYYRRPAAIFRSEDHGDHWQVFPTPFRMGGNEEGRNLGERLAIDPNKTPTLYFASRFSGLWKSANRGETWTNVFSFPWHGLNLPNDWHSHAGLSFVVFSPNGEAKGEPTKTIYVGLADPAAHHLFRSLDAGKTWSPVAGEPEASLLPGQAQRVGDSLYITYANAKGPYGATAGGVWKLNVKNGQWTKITPAKPCAYMGLAVDRSHPGTLAVATLDCDALGGDSIYRTTSDGKNWTDMRGQSKRDVHDVPWLNWGHREADFGWWITGLTIDPFHPNRMAYTTGATIYATDQTDRTGQDKTILWKPWVNGIEQTAVLTLLSPRKGPHLYSGFGDIGGFTHSDLHTSYHMQTNPLFTNTNAIDYAENAPNVVVRSGTHEPHAQGKTATLGYSTDYGKIWHPLYAPLPEGYVEKRPDQLGYNESDPYIDARISVSADGKTFVVMTPQPVLTRNRGISWQKITGLSASVRIVADRQNASVFYAWDYMAGKLFISRDGAKSFSPLAAKGLPPNIRPYAPVNRETQTPLKATPGSRGDLWLIVRGALFHSTDSGQSFTNMNSNIDLADFDFGKAASGSDHFALYALGLRDDTFAIWQSTDNGRSWVRINDEKHQYCRMFRAIAADKRVFGRVYVGIDGRGIIYGEPKP